MQRPMPMTREFIVKMLLDHHGFGHLSNTDVDAVWALDWEAVQITVKETGRAFLWWSIAPELAAAANEASIRCLFAMPLPLSIRKYS